MLFRSVTWTVTLAGGQSRTVTFLVQVLKEAEGGCIQNVASVSGNDVTLTSNRVRTYVEKPDTLLENIKDLIDNLPENSDSVIVNVDNSNKNEAAGGNAAGENTSKKDSSGDSAEKTGAAGNTSAKAGGTSLSANAPKTGDDSNIGLWAVIAVLALLAGGASAGYAIYKARKKDDEDA